MRGIDQALVEHQIATDVLLQVGMKMRAAVFERFAKSVQVRVGTAQRGQANGFGFKNMASLARLLQIAARQGL
ncbi:hypothetical protein D3C77_690200 [compost metagenome]